MGRDHGGGIRGFSVLDGSAIVGSLPRMWCILWITGKSVLEFVERALEVLRHGYVAGTIVLIPRNGQSTVEGPGPINGDGVHIF